MIVFPIIPVWAMLIICAVFIAIIIKAKVNLINRALIVLLLFFINLRIMIPSSESQSVFSNLDILFVIDNTISMAAEDCRGGETRLDTLKKDCEYITDSFPNARYSVITFGNNSQVLVPYTKDTNMMLEAINVIRVEPEDYARGSTLNAALEDMEQVLEGSKLKNNRTRIVFFISDGEITNGDSLNSFSSISKYIQNGAVLGYGSENGGYMKIDDVYGNDVYVQDTTEYPYKRAISKIDESNLRAIADDMKLEYINMSEGMNIKDKLDEIKDECESDLVASGYGDYADIYYIFAIPLLPLLIYEFICYKRKL